MSNEIIQNLGAIEQKLIVRHPTRKLVLEAAFRAHNMAEYFLSTPVFLAQADGICADGTTYKLFLTNDKKHGYTPKVSEWANTKLSVSLHKTLASALVNKGAFQLHHSVPNRIKVTRHSILHGESIDYGNEVNSLKAISLVVYLSDLTTGY